MNIDLTLEVDFQSRTHTFKLFCIENLENLKNNDTVIWMSQDLQDSQFDTSDYIIKIETKYLKPNQFIIQSIEKGPKIISSTKEIKDQFYDILFSQISAKELEKMDGLEPEDTSNINNNKANDIDQNPYDPKLIRVDTKPFSVFQVYGMIKNGEIDLSPDFQRHFVWHDITRKSRLIESLLLRIPLPVFYLSQDEEGLFKVIDGVQRLTVISDFLSNKFKLKNLEYLKDCEGKWFNNEDKTIEENLNPIYVRRIEQTQLFFNIIDPQTPSKVKYDIFRRINTGGKSLNAQEIRNCIEAAHVRNFIRKLSTSPEFLDATRNSISSTRMADEEIILRFIAFYLLDHNISNQQPYRGDMDDYLDKTVDLLNIYGKNYFDNIENAFKIAMINAKLLFGNNAFRKTSYINKSLFLSWSRILCDINTNILEKINIKHKLYNLLSNEINNNADYSNALSMATNDARNVELTYKIAQKLLNKAIYEE